jgi:uncharacterized coiled-coil protein SlyX
MTIRNEAEARGFDHLFILIEDPKCQKPTLKEMAFEAYGYLEGLKGPEFQEKDRRMRELELDLLGEQALSRIRWLETQKQKETISDQDKRIGSLEIDVMAHLRRMETLRQAITDQKAMVEKMAEGFANIKSHMEMSVPSGFEMSGVWNMARLYSDEYTAWKEKNR